MTEALRNVIIEKDLTLIFILYIIVFYLHIRIMAMIKLLRNRALLLRLFYTNPDQEYYIQEIGRILDKKPGVFQRNLYDMEKEGILRSEYRANARYFRINKDYPLHNEFKSIVFKTVGVSGSIKEILENVGPIDFSFLYGSYAKGNETSLSDIDLVIIGSPDENKIIREFEKLEGTLKREINYKLYSLKEFQEAFIHKDSFLLAILKDKKIMLIGEERGLRKIIEGTPYKKAKSRS
jgi:predicted nucleotidyltransferase